jgi:Family of unknown function (DUF6263)
MTPRSLSAAIGVWLTASLLAPPTPVSAQQVTLRWKYVAGSELVYRSVNRQKTPNPLSGGNAVNEQTQTMRWSVGEVAPNGDATVTVTTEHVQVEMSGPTGNVSYDSRTDEAPTAPEAQIFAAMAGLSYTMVIGPDGTLKSVQGMDQVIDRIMGALPAEVSALGQGILGEIFSEESLTNSIQQSIQVLPQEPVGPGGSWQRSFSGQVPVIGVATTNLTFTVDGIEERDGRTVAVISSTGDMVIGEGAIGQFAGMFEIGDAQITGTMDFDVDRGLVLSSTRNAEMTLSIAGQQMTTETVMTQTLIDYVPGG